MGPRRTASPTHRAAVRPGHGHVASPTHRATRPRPGRVLFAVVAAAVTTVAVLGAAGVAGPGTTSRAPVTLAGPPVSLALSGFFEASSGAGPGVAALEETGEPPSGSLPEGTGAGKRVVFAIGAQRVWLVGPDGQVERTYLVSGSLTDNLHPGVYEVYSTSRHAVGVDDSGTMEYMVRFTHGKRAPIGFHDIPVRGGQPVQAVSDLGTPQSHGCVRQRHRDARALWRFAPVGTTVVVTA